MPATLDDRADLRRAFFRLIGIAATDAALAEHDSEVEETVNYFIQHGLWNAQSWMLNMTVYRGWKTTSEPTWLGSFSEGGKYMVLPTDFLRAAGDDQNSPFLLSNGYRWGQEVEPSARGAKGDFFYVEGDRIYLTSDTAPPAGTLLEYHRRHANLSEETELDFPLADRPLIVAEAAAMALAESWLPFDSTDAERRVLQNLNYLRTVAAPRQRKTRTPMKYRGRKNYHGSQWF